MLRQTLTVSGYPYSGKFETIKDYANVSVVYGACMLRLVLTYMVILL